MGLNFLSNAEMIQTTSRWVDSQRATFQSIPEVAGLLPRVEAVHNDLLALPAPTSGATNPFADSQEMLDRRQDRFMRASHYLLRAYREYLLAQPVLDHEEIERLKTTEKILFPRGMAGTRANYLEEAGNAKVAQERLAQSPAAQQTIGKLRLTPSLSAQNLLDAWFQAAAELGASVQTQVASLPDGDPELGAKTLRARNAWISVARAVRSVLDQSAAPQAAIAAIRGPLDAIEDKATARAAAARVQPAKPAEPTPTV